MLIPQEVKDGIIYGIFLASYGTENDNEKYGEGFTIHLKDPLNSALMKSEPHKMKGTPLTAKDERRGYLNYNTQILQQINLEGESNFRCTFYSKDNKYENCVETNAKKEIREHLPCLPPWMTNNESEWCTDKIELNTGALIVIDRIMNGGTDCTKPCKDTIFEAKVYFKL